MSDVQKKATYKEINWVIIGIWIVLLIIAWIVYGIFAPNLVLFIIALVITVGGPILYYGLLWYKTSKTKKN
jgi:Flp pilus assembly protein TadB